MSKVNDRIDAIVERKDDITRAIAMAFADGDVSSVQKYYDCFKKMNDEAKVFIFKTNDNPNSYYASLQKMIGDINKKFGYGVDHILDTVPMLYVNGPYEADLTGVKEENIDKLHEAYMSADNAFIRAGYSYQNFIDMYFSKGLEFCLEYARMMQELQKKIKFYSLKMFMSSIKDALIFKCYTDEIGDMIDKYNITSLKDIKDFYTEVSSFFVDENLIDDEQKEIIKQNKEAFIKRVKNKRIANDKKKLQTLKNFLEELYSNEMTKGLLNNSNIKDFFKKNGFEFNKGNLKKIVGAYIYMHSCSGFHCISDFNNEKQCSIFFDNSKFDISSIWRNELVIHEFIHNVENPHFEIKKPILFSDKCRYLNEALTDYLAENALKYFEGDILKEVNAYDNEKVFISVYHHMLPLVELLKKSPLWEDLLECKLDNRYSYFKKKFGKYSNEIAKVFDEAYSNKYSFVDEYRKLKEIIKQVSEEKYNISKKVA